MSNYYEFLERKDLLGELELILFVESMAYCLENQVDYVRYGTLKKHCNEKLNIISDGVRPDFGGTFEHLLKRLASSEISKDHRYLTRTRSDVTNKDSRIYPNIPLIRTYLQKKQSTKRQKLVNSTVNFDMISRGRGLFEPVKATSELSAKVSRFREFSESVR